MGWTYGSDPSANDRDYVRFRIGDTDTTDQLISDEEIAGAVTITGSKQKAAFFVAKALLAKWARFVDSRMGKLDLKLSQRIAAMRELLPELEEEAGVGGSLGVPYMASDSKDARDGILEDDDRVEPAFAIAMHDVRRSHAESNEDYTDLRQ